MEDCFKDNRATLHLHGGTTPWISDGTAHQWTTPAGEMTSWPQGVSVENVPDMGAAGCDATDDGCLTFYYTNQQSARLLFYHDHAWGITRLNVYAGEAAGYLISDETEKALVGSWRRSSTASASVFRWLSRIERSSRMLRQLAAQDPDLGYRPLGNQRQLLVSPCLYARPEPRRPVRHECLRTLDVRSLVLAPRCRYRVRTDRQSILRSEL